MPGSSHPGGPGSRSDDGSTEASSLVHAPRGHVLHVLADLESYPQWNDEFAAVEVLERDPQGRPQTVRITLDSPMLKDELVLGYTWAGDTGMSWTLREPGSLVRSMDGSYSLADAPAGATSVTFRLAIEVSVPLIGPLRRKAEKTVIERALDGLAQRVEGTTWD